LAKAKDEVQLQRPDRTRLGLSRHDLVLQSFRT
jgi:hypothetical protein